jgi:hypothetical protein
MADDPCLAAWWPAGPELENQYYRARYYDPAAGRFNNEDPIAFDSGVNFHAYARNNPSTRIDPLGLSDTGWPSPHYNPPTTGAPNGRGFLSHFADQLDLTNLSGSVAQSGLSIYDSMAGIVTGDPARTLKAYDYGPLGQTAKGPGWARVSTRVTLVISGVAAVTAGGVMCAQVLGIQGFATIGPEWHLGLEFAGGFNLIHIGRHAQFGIHIAFGSVGPYVANFHIYIQRAFPFFRTWWPGKQ